MVWELALRSFGIRRNVTMEQAIEETASLIDQAKHEIRIVCGELSSIFYDNERIIQALRAAKERGVIIEIIHGPERDPKTSKILELQEAGKLTFYEATERPADHFMVVDSRHVRIEDSHPPYWPRRLAYIKYDTFFLAQEKDEEFKSLKDEATPVGEP